MITSIKEFKKINEEANFPSQFGIDDLVTFIPMANDIEDQKITDEERYGTVVAVRFSKAKVFYDVLDDYLGVIFKNVDSVKVKPDTLSTPKTIDNVLESHLVDHAENELALAGMLGNGKEIDDQYNNLVANAVIDLIKLFASQGHSGFSAGMVRDIFNKLANYQTLTPITSNPEEWFEVTDWDGESSVHQNRRSPATFSKDGGKTWYNLDESIIYKAKKIVYEKLEIKHTTTSIKEFRSSLNEEIYKDQVFTFFARQYDIQKAYELIEANPEKYKADNGEFYEFDLSAIEKWFSAMTPEDKEKLNNGGTVSIRGGVRIGYEDAMGKSAADLEEPGVWVVDDDGEFSILVDGWHRAYHLFKKGIKKMKIWVIQDPNDLKKVRIH